MLAYLILLVAIATRMVPPLFHLAGMNFTAVGASLLFFGSRRPRWQAGFAVASMIATDYLLTVYAYRFPFHLTGYLVTWVWYGLVCLLGHRWLARVTALRVAGTALTSSTIFFIFSNLVVWLGTMYPHTWAGLAACYTAALPFYRNDLVSTLLFSGVLFGLQFLANRRSPEKAIQGATA